MSEKSKKGGWRRYFTVRRALVNTGLAVYCLILLLAFDFAWSSLTMGEEKERSARVANPAYDHGFAPNFDGYDVWGEVRYRLVTNSLGFKDASTRNVPMKTSARRILLIGDSFAEGIGMAYEDSFAGLLDQAGQQRATRSSSSTRASHPIRRASTTRRSNTCSTAACSSTRSWCSPIHRM